MAQVIKEVAEFASKYRNHAAEVRLLLFEEKCPYEAEYPYHSFLKKRGEEKLSKVLNFPL